MIIINNINEKVKKGIIILLIIGILIFVWVFIRDWIKPRIISALGGYTEMEMKITKDTLSIKYNDIYKKYLEQIVKVDEINEPEYIDNYEYKERTKTTKSSLTGKSQPESISIITKTGAVKRYQTAVNDSILSGNIETIISIDSCKIVAQSLKYEPKIPYIREKIITVVEYRDRILSNEAKAYIGIGSDINSNNQITPKVIYLGKKKWLYNAGYTKSLDNKYPDAITVGISKLF